MPLLWDARQKWLKHITAHRKTNEERWNAIAIPPRNGLQQTRSGGVRSMVLRTPTFPIPPKRQTISKYRTAKGTNKNWNRNGPSKKTVLMLFFLWLFSCIVCLSLGCWELDVNLIVSLTEFTYLLYLSFHWDTWTMVHVTCIGSEKLFVIINPFKPSVPWKEYWQTM